jgi:hypothetical protein
MLVARRGHRRLGIWNAAVDAYGAGEGLSKFYETSARVKPRGDSKVGRRVCLVPRDGRK